MNKNFHFFICAHGFGHIKRVLGIIYQISCIDQKVSFNIYVKKSHYDKFSSYIMEWYPDLRLRKISFNFNFMNNSPDFINVTQYKYKNYINWINDLKSIKIKKESLVFSDNLIGVLSVFKQAILIGSFLWTEIKSLGNNQEFKKIFLFEEKLLKKYKPKLIGIEKIVMPNLLNVTNFIPFPWLCTNRSKKLLADNSSKILLSGGGSGKINNQIKDILEILQKFKGGLYVDNLIYNKFNFFEKFNFDESSFLEIKYIIGRPGIGLILECIRYSIPLLMIFEKDNEEMKHNSKIISELGLGIEINSMLNKSNELLNLLNKNELRCVTKKSFSKQIVGGDKLIAKYILNLN